MKFKKLLSKTNKVYYLSSEGDVFNLKSGFLGYLYGNKYCFYFDGKQTPIDYLVNTLFNDDYKQYVIHLDGDLTSNSSTNLSGTSSRGNLLRYYYTIKGKSRGVYKFNYGKKPWRAALKINNKLITVGYYNTKKEAQVAYEAKYLEEYGMLPLYFGKV